MRLYLPFGFVCAFAGSAADAQTSPFSEASGSPRLNGSRDVNSIASACSVPAAARAFALNATVVPPAFMGYISLWPQGAAQPWVSTLNAIYAAITSNMAVVPTNSGSVSAFSSHATDLLLDISGYFAPWPLSAHCS